MKLDGKSIQGAITQLVEDYKFEAYRVIDIVQLGIKSGFKKDYPEYRKAELQVHFAADGTVMIYRELRVVENDLPAKAEAYRAEHEDERLDNDDDEETQSPLDPNAPRFDEHKDIILDDAKKIKADVKVGEKLYIDVTPVDLELSRIAAQAAGQTIKQQLKGVERERFFEKFQNKQGELLKGIVTRITGESVVLDIDNTAVVLPPEGQIPKKIYALGEEVFVLLKQISKGAGGIVLDISQSNEEYIEAILKKLVPELEEGLVSIKKIVRIPGKRTKIVVDSQDPNIDAIGVFIGHRGDRINMVLHLLDGEKVDYVQRYEDQEAFVRECLKPATIDKVTIGAERITLRMAEDQKPLAIGKAASNIKLATRILGYPIDIV